MKRPYFCVKSELIRNKITFEELIIRLKDYIKIRINSGEFTERGLARILQVSQPHLHNMLKGVRTMNIEFADKVLAKFQISIIDLIDQEEIWKSFDERERKPPKRSIEREFDPRAPWKTGT